MANGNVMKIPISEQGGDINISEEMNKSGVWQSLEGSNGNNKSGNGNGGGSKSEKPKSHAKKRMSIVEEEEDAGISIKASLPLETLAASAASDPETSSSDLPSSLKPSSHVSWDVEEGGGGGESAVGGGGETSSSSQ